MASYVTVDSSQLVRGIPATYSIFYTLNYTDPTTSKTINQRLTLIVNITGTPATQAFAASSCPGGGINLYWLIFDFSFQASYYLIYDRPPSQAGATPFAGSPAFRGRMRYSIVVRPTSSTTYWARTFYRSGGYIDVPIRINVVNCGGAVLPIVMLEGAYYSNTGVIRNSLQQANVLPLQEPYSALGYTFVGGGGEAMSQTAMNQHQLVDWVLVEVRDSVNPEHIIYSRAALLKTDGQVVDTDGVSPVSLTYTPPGDYYIAIRHRNHLAIMPDKLFHIQPGSQVSFDLSDPQTPVYGSLGGRQQSQTKALMYAGDADGNGQIQNTDDVLHWSLQAGGAGYQSADFNLDGQVQNSERVHMWKKNVGRGSGVPKSFFR